MNKKNKLLFALLPSIFTVGVLSSVVAISSTTKINQFFNDEFVSKNYLPENSNPETLKEEYPLVASQANGQNAYLSAKTGPIVYWGDKITSLDWFGAERWTVDINSVLTSPTHNGDWKRAWFNWDYDRENDVLWILTAGNWRTNDNVNQKLIAIDVKTGNDYFSNSKPQKYTEISFPYNRTDVRFLSVLKSGDILMYGGARLGTNSKAYLYKKKENKISEIPYDFTNSLNSINTQSKDFTWYFFNLISIGNNLNIAEFVQFPTGAKSNFDVYGILVDDNLKEVKNGVWNSPKLIANGLEGFNNRQTTPQRDYYYLTNGTVVTVLFNKLVLFDPKTTNMKVLRLTNDIKWVQSWTFDASDNLYYKYRNDTSIYKINTSNIQSTQNDNLLSPTTYFDIKGAVNNNVNKYADNYILYNVHGYTGQIMMINSRYKEDPNFTEIPESEILEKQYGLAVAISENKNEQDKGDIKGLLNTENAFLQAANFKIKDDVLRNKLPSEITSSDFDYLNESFLTKNNSLDENGSLKYPQFTKEIDDKIGYLKVQVNLDQIPWFVTNGQMPSDIAPKTLTFVSNDANKISTRVTWKNENLDYDFKNTLPSKLTIDDVNRFDPFSINIQSQNTSLNKVSYPNKKYEIISANDTDGKVKIKAVFKYIPLGVDLKASNVKTYEEEKEYKIFSSNDHRDFKFIGKNENKEENIKDIPELKELSLANLLPSSFNTTDTSSILRFINTESSSGYPLSKMIFNIEPNDTNGTITITGKLPPNYYPNEENKVFTKTYIGLNKISDYSFNVNKQGKIFEKKKYRPSEITEQIVYEKFVTYRGFNSSDLFLDLIPNDDTGELVLKFNLNYSYPETIAKASGFIKSDNGYYVREDKISGFKTNSEYQTQYEVKFIDDNSTKLDDIKKYTPKQIEQSLNKTENDVLEKESPKLVINGEEIKNEKDLPISVIDSLGSNLPKKEDLKSNSVNSFEYNVYYNDPNGEITIKLTFKNIDGVSGDLVFIQRFTGFAKGNQVTTNDILSFKTQSRLMSDNPIFKQTLPSELASKLESDSTKKEEIKKYISYYSGAYATAIDSNKFKLEVTSDDIYGYLTIKIIFDQSDITDKNSLLTYTVTYNGFATE
ncbi:lipoprotein 17-related variable surface protein [Malacoplasma iowae]|uniref:Lipoprotein 17-related variable surface protein n=1 Tax=Malacoplasma iowae 695 TaxID=1048830 RepID=A0A6P1LNK7_MALIO|nr:lipoprotein 17-related variable surface protein [Malacoplasma iowae]QHG90102.1 lipoprotein 17-related variable surface protein [Malacoplasma iowae 695]WPL36160.1 lipoprotein 17-related variable surface protein [Malacoplasma iowae]VEU61833.1 Domain of uncharacterised function (DUF1976) [Mycoplasmopsis fermentans]VEU70953.1 Domain of uncharacterised function (DUF1976) [Malacoplasma iowae]